MIKKYAYKNNNLILLFSLIGEITILPQLSGSVMNVNSLFDLFCIVYQSKIVLSENTKNLKLYIVCYFQRQSGYKHKENRTIFFGR
jgi:hypothetical protein